MTINSHSPVIQLHIKRGCEVKTLYIDVYFLINLTVDYISLYFAATLAKVPTSNKRLLLGAILGALVAVAIVFLPEIIILKIAFSVFGLALIAFVSTKRISLRRRAKFTLAFVIFESLIGAGVHYVYGLLDTFLYDYLSESAGGAYNRRLIFLSLIILLSIGVFKMLISFFSNIESEGSATVEISFLDKTLKTEAFIDSGNLAMDPMDMRPVLFLKRGAAASIFPESVIDLTDPDTLEREIRKRIRLVPVSRGGTTHVLTGIRADSVKILSGDRSEEISVTLAIDKEGGTYGGFEALLPSAAISDVII